MAQGISNIDDQLDIIRNAPSGEGVRDAIIECMKIINENSNIKLYPLTISGKLSEISTAPYTPKKNYAFSQVTLDITDDSGEEKNENPIQLDEFVVDNDTDPHAEFNAETLLGENHYWNKITTNLDVSYPTDIADMIEVPFSQLEYDSASKTYGYSAIREGYSAMKSIVFTDFNGASGGSSGGGGGGGGSTPGGYCKVTFMNNAGKIVDTQTVPYGGHCEYKGVIPPDDNPDGILTGWSPDPSSGVTTDMTPRPIYSSGDVRHDTIPTSTTWDYIAKNPGEFNVGDVKTLRITDPNYNIPAGSWTSQVKNDQGEYMTQTTPKAAAMAFNIPFMIVAKGEGSTHLTFLALKGLNGIYKYAMPQPEELSGKYGANGNTNWDIKQDWGECWLRRWLNQCFIECLPKDLKSNLKIVNKVYSGVTSYLVKPDYIEKTDSGSKIWIPSMAEITSQEEIDQAGGGAYGSDCTIESSGVDYRYSGWLDYVYEYEGYNPANHNDVKVFTRTSNESDYDMDPLIYMEWSKSNNEIAPGNYGRHHADFANDYRLFIGFCL